MNRDDTSSDPSVSGLALRLLARRPLTEQELRERLERKGHLGGPVDEACAELRRMGYLDDRRLALEFIHARSERLRHGPERLIGDLVRRGVARSVAGAAWDEAVECGDVSPDAPLRARISRRMAGRFALDPAGYARMYNALRRAGFDDEAIRRELKPFQVASGYDGASATEEITDDLP